MLKKKISHEKLDSTKFVDMRVFPESLRFEELPMQFVRIFLV